MKVPLVVLSVAVVLTSFAAEAPEVTDATLQNYQALHKMTDKPRSIGMQFVVLCAPPPAAIATHERTGPHYATGSTSI